MFLQICLEQVLQFECMRVHQFVEEIVPLPFHAITNGQVNNNTNAPFYKNTTIVHTCKGDVDPFSN
jgi:hypothetical protein